MCCLEFHSVGEVSFAHHDFYVDGVLFLLS